MKFLALLILLTIQFACSREVSYDFQVKNETDYYINEVSVNWCYPENKTITLPPNSTSDVFTLYYKVSGYNLLAPGSLCSRVLSYSDPDSIYYNVNGYGNSVVRDYLDRNDLNVMVIKKIAAPGDSNRTFEVVLQK